MVKRITKDFDVEYLIEELGLPYDADDGVVMEDKIVDTLRWSVVHWLVFKHEDRYWRCSYSVGATEQQDESPWEYADKVECVEMEHKEVTRKEWVIKEKDDD